MVTIGNDTLPGTILTLESATSTGANIGAPGVPVILGQGYLSEGNASAGEAKRITRPKAARDEFGPAEKSMLTQQVQDALVAGAYPVYAIAATENSVSSEDLSGESGQTATLGNAPVQEVAGDIVFTVNSTTKTTVLYYEGDPANATVGSDEVYLNPVTGKFKVDESMGSAGDSVDYTYLDYTAAFDELTTVELAEGFIREIVDFVGIITENSSVRDTLETEVDSMENNGWLAIGVAGAGEPYISDTSTYTDSYDNSRLQLIYPSRDSDGGSLLGAYLGLRSSIGIDSSPIFSRMTQKSSLLENLTVSEQEDLVNAKVIPLEEQGGGAKVMEDLTTVADDNTAEASWTQGVSRLITDFVAETVNDIAENFIGDFNDVDVQNTLRGNIAQELKALLESRAIEAYSIIVEEVDSTTVAVDIGINTADPLRNIDLTVSAGAVQNGVQVEAN